MSVWVLLQESSSIGTKQIRIRFIGFWVVDGFI